MAYPAPTGREMAIEALLDREPHGDAYRVSRVLVCLLVIFHLFCVVSGLVSDQCIEIAGGGGSYGFEQPSK